MMMVSARPKHVVILK